MHRRIAGLDLIRGLAIALVILRHAWPATFGSGGIVGVVVFFALSGYLITGLLVSDITRHGRVRYGRFYRNRALRLIPPLLLMLTVLSVITLAFDPLNEKAGLLRALIVSITYTGDLPFNLGSRAIDHLWTLATEEQFYLIWPLILTLGLRSRKVGLVIGLAAGVLLAALLGTMVLSAHELHRIYRLPTSWALAMVIGSAARIWEPRVVARLPTGAKLRGSLGVACVAGIVAVSFIPDSKDSPLSYLLLGPFAAVAGVVLIQVWSDWRELPTAALRPLLALGTISYAAYLWDYPIVVWLHATLPTWTPILSIVLTILAATFSWWVIERPVLSWKARLDARAKQRSTVTGSARA
jgi:peptidoglycan/LPS O-acetylase OafA/YrhL